ncbi:type II secretion system protein GspJ [Thermaurantiacus sp.]
MRAGGAARPAGVSRGGGAGGAAGFTLVELLVALVLFSLLALAATALTGAALAGFTRTEAALGAARSIERARALMAADLGQAAPRISLDAEGRPVQAFTLTPSGFVLVRRGVTGLPPRVQKIAWGHDGDRLLRQGWPAVDGTLPDPPTVMLEGVEAVRIRVDGGRGFGETWVPATPEALPRALELTIVPRGGPPVVLLFLVAT